MSARPAEDNAALQARMMRLCAEENAGRITASARKFRHSETGARLEPETVAEAMVQQAAQLDDLEYDSKRKILAGNAGLRVAVLDAERAKRRGAQSANGEKLQGAAVLFSEPEPWPESVDGAAVLADAAKILTEYVHLPDGAATAISLWIAYTHAAEAFVHAPRLNVTAPTKGAGKTLLLDVIASMAPRALRTESVTEAVIFRLIEKHRPVIMLDEADRALPQHEELTKALNAGFTRGGVAMRCEGDNNEVRVFKVFTPAVICGIGRLPGTLADRSIRIELERAKPGEVRKRFDCRHVERETEIKRRLARWAADRQVELEAVDPEMPGAFNRVADLWRPLFTVAAVAGGDWPKLCAAAFARLQVSDPDSEPMAVQLLQDAAAFMDRAGVEIMPSADLVERLATMNERPWPTWNHGKPISPRQVANLLRGFGIRPQKFRDDESGITPGTRGYQRRDFVDPLARYVSSATPPQPNGGAASELFASATASNPVADRKTLDSSNGAACGAVADKAWGLDL